MKAKKIVMGCTVVVFFLMILFPLWGWVLPQPVLDSLNEKRALTELSQTGTAKERIKNAEAYLDDHLAFRNVAISATLQTDLALGVSPSDLVLAGSDGWLYFVEGGEDFRRGTGLTDEQIKEFYDIHQHLTDYFAASDEEERFRRSELLRLKKEQGIEDDGLYHYDTPLTVEHEKEALLSAGFSAVDVLNNWGPTYTLKATK